VLYQRETPKLRLRGPCCLSPYLLQSGDLAGGPVVQYFLSAVTDIFRGFYHMLTLLALTLCLKYLHSSHTRTHVPSRSLALVLCDALPSFCHSYHGSQRNVELITTLVPLVKKKRKDIKRG
jgi:hypothetical protein